MKSLNQPKSVGELEHLIKIVDKWNICKGGPPETYCAEVKLKCANKIDGVWRHSDCEIVLDEGHSCMKCCSVYILLNKCVDRKNAQLFRRKYNNKITMITEKCNSDWERQTMRNSIINTTPRTKKHIKILQNRVNQCEKKLTRRDQKIKSLQQSYLEIASKKEGDITSLIEKNNVPDEQVKNYFSLYKNFDLSIMKKTIVLKVFYPFF